MRTQEIQHSALRPCPADRLTQGGGCKSRQVKETLRAPFLTQHPAERVERNDRGLLRLIFRNSIVCHQSNSQLQKVPKTSVGGTEAFGDAMTKRILVVEDNDLNRKLFCDVLAAGGFAVEPCADGNMTLERARGFLPNLVVMDIQLQDVSGLDLIASMKGDSDLREVPVLAVTAYAGKGDEERIRKTGAAGYLSKPASIGPFMAAVRGLIEKAA